MIVLGLFVVAAAVGFGVWHHLTGARLELSASPRSSLGMQGCLREVQGFGWGLEPARTFCAGASGRPWLHAVVANVGGRGAWVTSCVLHPYDTEGRPIPELENVELPMKITAPGVGAGPYLGPGDSAELDWFLPANPVTRVASYTGTCGTIVYRNPPV